MWLLEIQQPHFLYVNNYSITIKIVVSNRMLKNQKAVKY